MRVESVTQTPDTLRKHVYYAGTHLVNYDPTHYKNRAEVVTIVENGVFEKFLEKANGQLDLMFTTSTREKQFLAKRLQHSTTEELFQRLNYIHGVHFSKANQLHFDTSR